MSETSFFGRFANLFKFQDAPSPIQDATKVSADVQFFEKGSSGTEVYSGFYLEEYLQALQGREASDVFDKMRRQDPKVKMCLSAVKFPIKSAVWEIEPADEDEVVTAKTHAEFIEQCLFEDLGKSWKQFLGEATSCIDFGHSVFEIVHKVVRNDPTFGTYIGVQKLGFRSQKTIDEWGLCPKTGALDFIRQCADGDLSRAVDIPGKHLLVFSVDKEGDNYEGVSMLRPCYGPWLRKQKYTKLQAIGIEKFAIPAPVLDVPEGDENSKKIAEAKKHLALWVSHQKQYITKPNGWPLEFVKTNFDAEKIQTAIDAENQEIVNAFLANFLMLGQGTSGSYALSFDLSDFFLSAIEHIAEAIAEEINRKLIPDLIKLNFGPQKAYPKLKVSGIADKAGEEIAKVLKMLVDAKVIIPDDQLEAHMRKKYAFPAASDEGQRQVQNVPVGPASPAFADPKKKIVELADAKHKGKARQQMKEDEKVLRENMQTGLRQLADGYKDRLMNIFKTEPPSRHLSKSNTVEFKGQSKYKAGLTEDLTLIADEALKQARREVPQANDVKLADSKEFKALPKEIQRRVKAQADLLTTTQLADLEKVLLFQFQNYAAVPGGSAGALEKQLNDSIDRFIDGPAVAAAAANSTSNLVNGVRESFFFTPDVSVFLESMTFRNPDPKSAICQNLTGTTFSLDDPGADRFLPPLHHNCKSYLEPNISGQRGNPKLSPQGLQPTGTEKQIGAAMKSITLDENSNDDQDQIK